MYVLSMVYMYTKMYQSFVNSNVTFLLNQYFLELLRYLALLLSFSDSEKLWRKNVVA